jgi:hypothetical protein
VPLKTGIHQKIAINKKNMKIDINIENKYSQFQESFDSSSGNVNKNKLNKVGISTRQNTNRKENQRGLPLYGTNAMLRG